MALWALVAAAALVAAESSRSEWLAKQRELAAATATLQISTVPPIGSTDPVTGTVTGVAPADYKIIVYAIDSAGAWWGAKYFRTVTYPIAAGGTFSTDQWASGAPTDDVVANLYVAVVPQAYDPVSGHVWGNTNSIPDALHTAQVAGILLARPAAGTVWTPTGGSQPAASPAASTAASPAASVAASVAASPSNAAAAPQPSSAGAPAASPASSPDPSSAVAASPASSPAAAASPGSLGQFRPVAQVLELVRQTLGSGNVTELIGFLHNTPLPGNDFKIAVFMTQDGAAWVDAIQIAARPLISVNTTGGFNIPLVVNLLRYLRLVVVPNTLDFNINIAGQQTGMYPQVVQSALASATYDTLTGQSTVDSSVSQPVNGASAPSGSGNSGSPVVPGWGIAIIVVGGCLLIAGVGVVTGLAVRRRRQASQSAAPKTVTVQNPASRQAVNTAVDSKVAPQ